MGKIKVAVVSYGNIGRFSVEAIQAAPDMQLVGVVRRAVSAENTPIELKGVKVVSDISELGEVDVAILCSPTRIVPEVAKTIMEKGVSTVNSFDIHGDEMLNLRTLLNETGRKHNSKAIISAGGSRKRLGDSYADVGHGAQRNYLYQFWSRYEHGTFGGCEEQKRRQRGPFYDHPHWDGYSSADGVC